MAVAISFTTVGTTRAGPAAGRPTLTKEAPATSNVLAPVIRTPADGDGPPPRPRLQNSPSLAVDPTDSRFVVLANRLDGPDFSCDLQISGNGGAGWVPARPVPKLPTGAEKCYAPEVAFDEAGRLYYLFVGLHTEGNEPMGVFLTTSVDRGRSFSVPKKVLGPLVFQVRMAIDPGVADTGRLHLVWLQAGSDPPLGGLPPTPNPIMAAYSDDGGERFSEPTQVNDPAHQRAVAPALAIGADHAVHVAYYDLGDDARDYQGLAGPTWEGKWAVVLASSSDGGRSFATRRVVDDQVAPPERVMLIFTMAPPALAADRSGRVYAAWHDARNGDWDVFLRASGDNGRTWSPPRRLNDTPESDGRHQYLARLALADDGRLDAIFYDRRDDPDNVRNDVFYTFSTDGGRRFSPNLKLTSAPSDTRIGQTYVGAAAQGLVEFGSRLALVADGARVLTAWTDTRNAVSAAQQDIFSRAVVHPRQGDSGPPGAALVLLVIALAFGFVLVVTRRRRHAAAAMWGLVLVALGAVPGCSGDGETAAALPAQPEVVAVTLAEYSVDRRPDVVEAGRVVFEVHNAGRRDHSLTLFRIPDQVKGTLDEQLHSPRRLPASPLAVLATRRPGQDSYVALDLPPGRYGLVCFLKDADGTAYALKGMNGEVTVSPAEDADSPAGAG